jgi:hypothetical protein
VQERATGGVRDTAVQALQQGIDLMNLQFRPKI